MNYALEIMWKEALMVLFIRFCGPDGKAHNQYGCETWSLTLRDEHRLRVFENKVLRRIFGPNRNEMVGGWRKLTNEELHSLYSSIIRMFKSRRMRLPGHVARMDRRGMSIGFWCESRKERDH
jgi:hypothetical protein